MGEKGNIEQVSNVGGHVARAVSAPIGAANQGASAGGGSSLLENLTDKAVEKAKDKAGDGGLGRKGVVESPGDIEDLENDLP